MDFVFEQRPADVPFAQSIWRTESERSGWFPSRAVYHWELVVTRLDGKTSSTIRGPETKATIADYPANAEFFGIQFKMGTFMPHLSARSLVDGSVTLPQATKRSFWLHHDRWEIPTFENADVFVDRLVRRGLLVCDPVVDAAFQGHVKDVSLRSVQRRFVQATGLTHKTIQQIDRARHATTLLEGGMTISDTVHELGYFDQSHLTNSLRRFTGQTPAQIIRLRQST